MARLIAAFVRWQDKNRRRDKRLRRYTLRVFACVAFLLAITGDTFDSRRVVQSDETRSIRSRSFDSIERTSPSVFFPFLVVSTMKLNTLSDL